MMSFIVVCFMSNLVSDLSVLQRPTSSTEHDSRGECARVLSANSLL